MAAGRFDVRSSRKESYHCRNGYHDRDFTRGRIISHKNGYASYVDGFEKSGGRDSRKFYSSSGGGSSGDAFASKTRAGRNGVSKIEDTVAHPPTKKRKISPIVWDRDDKEVRVSSRNRIVPKRTPLCSPPSSPDNSGKLKNVAADGDVAVDPVTATQLQTMQISPVKSHVAAGSGGNYESEPLPKNNNELGQMEDQEYIQAHHISTSRWAADDTEDAATPESGEFRRQRSSSPSRKLSLLIRSDDSEKDVGNDRFMEIDEKYDGVARVSHLDSGDDDSSSFLEPASPKPRRTNMLEHCGSFSRFENVRKINEGTYGVVYKARDKETGKIVALKKAKMNVGGERDGFPLSALREINILYSLHHPSIVDVQEVVIDNRDDVFLVMEYMECDVKGFIEVMKQPLSEKEVKCLMLQLLEGVKYLHDNWVLHRDLKTSNLLLNKGGKLKVCDFGLSRQYGSPLKPYTPLVVTLWYRAPELLLGTKQYSTAIDMWSVGCILAELLAKQPLFSGETEIDQLDKIFKILGTPSKAIWPGFSKLPGAKAKFAKQTRNKLREKFPAISFKGDPVLSERGFDLLSQLLTYDPEKRITAEAAVRHSWFTGESEQELVSVQESLARRIKYGTRIKPTLTEAGKV